MRLIALHFTSLQLIAKWAKSFYWKMVLRRYWTPSSRMVYYRKHQRPRKMEFLGTIPLKRKKSRKWLINSRDFSSILYDFQPIFVGISVYWWALECKNYLPMQNLAKMVPSISSEVISPVISPRLLIITLMCSTTKSALSPISRARCASSSSAPQRINTS